MIKGIGHAAFVVKDREKSLHFYCDILGFEKIFELNNSNGEPTLVYLKVQDGQFIELFYNGQVDLPEFSKANVGYYHLCLEVDDVQEIANHLKQNGLTLLVEPKQGRDLNYQCWVKDPDGNRIEFMQMNPESLQSKSSTKK